MRWLRLKGARGLAQAPHHWGWEWNPRQSASTACLLIHLVSHTKECSWRHMWGQSTHCQALHAWGWGQLSPPCFRSVIYSSEGALGKICQDERWLDGRLTHRGTGSPTPPHTHSHWLPLSTPSYSIKISACASLSQVKTYSHTHITCLTRLTRLTLCLLSQEFPSGISAGATGTRDLEEWGAQKGGDGSTTPRLEGAPEVRSPQSLRVSCIDFAQMCFWTLSSQGRVGQAPWPQSSAFRVG